MNEPGNRQSEAEFERNARAMFDASIASLDARTLSRLNQARNRALQAASAASSRRHVWLTWAPAGALAAGVLAVALVLRLPATAPSADAGPANPPAPVELLAAGEDLDIAAEADLGFFEWIASAQEDGVGG